jgi:hypothetical protein
MTEPASPFKKKSPPAALPRALDEGVAPRPLFPAHRVAVPIGLVAIGAIAFLEMSPSTLDPEACATSYKPSIFERGAAAATDAFDRLMGRSYGSPGRGTPTVAGAVAVMPPVGTTPIGPTTLPSHLGVIGPAVPTDTDGDTDSTTPPVTGSKPIKKHVSPTMHVRPAGRPAGPRFK